MKLSKKFNKSEKQLPGFVIKLLIHINNQANVVALWLQNKTSGCSSQKLKAGLVIFCVAFLSESFYVAFKNFEQKDANYLNIKSFKAAPLQRASVWHPFLSSWEFKNIKCWKAHLDSIQSKKSNHLFKDSSFYNNQKMLDTINLLENIYYEQQSKKH